MVFKFLHLVQIFDDFLCTLLLIQIHVFSFGDQILLLEVEFLAHFNPLQVMDDITELCVESSVQTLRIFHELSVVELDPSVILTEVFIVLRHV